MWYQTLFWKDENWRHGQGERELEEAQLVLYFGTRGLLETGCPLHALQQRFPKALLFGCSSAGEILGDEVVDDSLVAAALRFKDTSIHSAWVECGHPESSWDSGQRLGELLKAEAPEDLAGVFVLSEGIRVNGSELVRGLYSELGPRIPLSGALAGDGQNFKETVVGCGFMPRSGIIAAIGFSGAVQLGHGSVGGWDPFGPQRLITRSKGSTLFELDGKPALDLYKTYLGEEAANLPGSALLFPLVIRPEGPGEGLVRTVLSIDEQQKCMTFAGDLPQGSVVQLMRANFDRLIQGAGDAASLALGAPGLAGGLALLISCVGRKMILGQRTADEVEAVADILGPGFARLGLYSYGEISPHGGGGRCELHNQTMTISLFGERP
jgi:hypothetical protein